MIGSDPIECAVLEFEIQSDPIDIQSDPVYSDRIAMTKTLTAEYDATERVLRLDQPLEGVQDHAKVEVTVDESVPVEPKQSWRALSGSLSKEAGDSLARAHEEMFPPWNGNDD